MPAQFPSANSWDFQTPDWDALNTQGDLNTLFTKGKQVTAKNGV